ncbi:MAG: IS66 family transposase [Acetobacteraceae bacterium]|nr:IS66 family transposase [Acetobacteraceae bacterium]
MSDPFIPPETLDAQLREQLAAALPEPLWQKLNGSLQREQQRLRSTEERLRLAEYKVRLLEERLRLMRLNKYGPGSEKLSDAQLALLEVEPGVSVIEVAAESQREPLIAPRPAKPAARPHPGRQQLPAHLPRVERLIACTPEQCICGQCGKPTRFIGYEQSEQLDVEPAKYFVLVTKREKRACETCEEQGVACAPLPARIIEKGLASDRVVIDTVVRKYSDHLPLYRQSVILERETGLQISRATLDGWVMQVGDLLRPIVGAMRQELLGGCYLQADETTVGVQMHDGRGQNHQAYLWQYGQPRGSVVFDFRLGRERDGPKRFLGDFAGRLQSDGYGAYDHVGGQGLVHVACWAHARRKFFEAVKLNAQDVTALEIVAQMDALFALDAQARAGALSLEARHELRLQNAPPLLEQLKAGIEAARAGALPQSALAKACAYTLTLWGRLTRFLDYPEVELSNNLAENSMRPVALGRKNWIHIGSKEAGPRVANILSVVETCRRLVLPVRDYLAAVLPGLADFPVQRVGELTPAVWATHRERPKAEG